VHVFLRRLGLCYPLGKEPQHVTESRSPIRRIIHPRDIDLGGLRIRRCLPAAGCPGVGPWVFFDHIGPASFGPGAGVDVIPHPHIGLATVTYLFEGQLVHRDSLGSVQTILPGEINLMLAGRGIVHSERTGPELRAAGHRLHGLQLWFALPAKDEEREPAFHHYAAAALPETRADGVSIRLLIGEAWGQRSPVPTWSATLYAEAAVPAGARLELPSAAHAPELALYGASGGPGMAGDEEVPLHGMAVLAADSGLQLTARRDSRVALIGGALLGRRSMWWNFVSSRPQRIQQARADWQAGRFAEVPGESQRAALPRRDAFCEEHCA